MSQFNSLLSAVSGGGSSGITVVASASNETNLLFPRLGLSGDLRKGDIVFFLGAAGRPGDTVLKPSFTQAWSTLASLRQSDTYSSSLRVSYHVLKTPSKGMVIGIDTPEYTTYVEQLQSHINSSPLAVVLRGVDPNSIEVETKGTANTPYAYFNPISVKEGDYTLAVGVTATSRTPFNYNVAAGSDFFITHMMDTKNYEHCLSGALVRKHTVAGTYTEPTWTIPQQNEATDSSVTAIIKLSPK